MLVFKKEMPYILLNIICKNKHYIIHTYINKNKYFQYFGVCQKLKSIRGIPR